MLCLACLFIWAVYERYPSIRYLKSILVEMLTNIRCIFMKDGTKKFGILSTSQAFAPTSVANEKNEQTVKIGYLSSFQIILNDRHGQPVNKGLYC